MPNGGHDHCLLVHVHDFVARREQRRLLHIPLSGGLLSKVPHLLSARSGRSSSYDRTGGNSDYVKVPSGQTVTLAELSGAGVVKHIWITISSPDPLHRRNLVLRAYWDGQDHPSLESPIGDFFGQGWGMKYNFSSLSLADAPKEGNALVCYFPMPYAEGARITVENQGEADVDALYYTIDYEEHETIGHDLGRFHAWYNQELTRPEGPSGDTEWEPGPVEAWPGNKSDAHNYLVCDLKGQGHFVGMNYYVNSPGPLWYGEGDDMFSVDGEPWPFSAHGTGTEDYFNQAWGPDEHFLHPYFGTARAPGRY